MEEIFIKLKSVLKEFTEFKCNFKCSECPFGKTFNPDFYDDKIFCDILSDINDYIEINDI